MSQLQQRQYSSHQLLTNRETAKSHIRKDPIYFQNACSSLNDSDFPNTSSFQIHEISNKSNLDLGDNPFNVTISSEAYMHESTPHHFLMEKPRHQHESTLKSELPSGEISTHEQQQYSNNLLLPAKSSNNNVIPSWTDAPASTKYSSKTHITIGQDSFQHLDLERLDVDKSFFVPDEEESLAKSKEETVRLKVLQSQDTPLSSSSYFNKLVTRIRKDYSNPNQYQPQPYQTAQSLTQLPSSSGGFYLKQTLKSQNTYPQSTYPQTTIKVKSENNLFVVEQQVKKQSSKISQNSISTADQSDKQNHQLFNSNSSSSGKKKQVLKKQYPPQQLLSHRKVDTPTTIQELLKVKSPSQQYNSYFASGKNSNNKAFSSTQSQFQVSQFQVSTNQSTNQNINNNSKCLQNHSAEKRIASSSSSSSQVLTVSNLFNRKMSRDNNFKMNLSGLNEILKNSVSPENKKLQLCISSHRGKYETQNQFSSTSASSKQQSQIRKINTLISIA